MKLHFFIKFFINVSLSDIIIATVFLGPFSVVDAVSNIFYKEKQSENEVDLNAYHFILHDVSPQSVQDLSSSQITKIRDE